MTDLTSKPGKILIIEDDEGRRKDIRLLAESLGYEVETAASPWEAELELRKAEEDGSPFSVATIDMHFKVEKEGMSSPRGTKILRYIKSKHPYVACIMISGVPAYAHEILNLRDDDDLDYYVSKDMLDEETLDQAITRAMRRVRPLGNIEIRLEMAKKTLGILKGNCLLCARNLAEVEQKKAQRGIDVSVSIENEIRTYKTMLEHFREGVRQTEEEIREMEEEICHLKGS